MLLQDFTARAAQRRPLATALVEGDRSFTYGEIEAASNRLACVLRAAGCKSGSRVALFLPKGHEAIIGMLGVMKASSIYVPVDVASPPARVAKIMASCEPAAVLLAGRFAGLYRDAVATACLLSAPRVVLMDQTCEELDGVPIDFDLGDLSTAPVEAPPCRSVDTDPAHILFTSGSTGEPKGVIVTHRSVVAFVNWALEYFDLSPDDRTSGHSPFHFDLSTFDIHGTFGAGAQLHLVPPESNLLPQKMADFIRGRELTQWFSVPAALNFMAKFDVIEDGDFPALRRLLWCGEVLPTPTLIYLMERLPHVSFTNLYGPTEAAIASSFYTVTECPSDPRESVPIGTACRGEKLRVLDEGLHPVPMGVVGDLYIEGVGLSPGYWKDPERTAAVFLQSPFSSDSSDTIYKTGDLARVDEAGLIHFLGRADSQIKSRGHRIELGEIEAALHALDELQEGAIVAVETDGFEGVAICCAYVPLTESALRPATLASALRSALPRYMIPARWRAFEALPKNANGKIDRKRLREVFQKDVVETR